MAGSKKGGTWAGVGLRTMLEVRKSERKGKKKRRKKKRNS
jgi:hypothetical protein